MKRCLICLLLGAGAVQAEGLTSRGEWVLYGAHYVVDEDSTFNPGNHLISQASAMVASEFRPDVAWNSDALTLNLKPRFLLEKSSRSEQGDLWLNEANLRWRASDTVSIALGREVLLWGPSQFWNPSNPFYVDNGKVNAKSEVLGKDFVRARWQLGEDWSLSAISQLGRGHSDSGAYRIDALKLDWVGSEASASAILAMNPGESLQVRNWAQWTLNDACLLYAEAAWTRNRVMKAQRATTPTGWLVNEDYQAYRADISLGLAYTFLNGWTLNGEYFHHSAGLSDREYANWNQLTADDAPLWGKNPLVTHQLGTALSPGTYPLRRNYLGVQLRNGSDEKWGWNLRYNHSLDDHSGQWVAQASYDLNDRWQIWANAVIQHGRPSSEYGRWLNRSAMLGLTWFAW